MFIFVRISASAFQNTKELWNIPKTRDSTALFVTIIVNLVSSRLKLCTPHFAPLLMAVIMKKRSCEGHKVL